MPIRTKKVDGHCRIIYPFGGETPKQNAIIRAIRRAQLWEEMLCNGEAKSVMELSGKIALKEGYVRQILTLNNLAPDIVSAILAGNEPDGLSLARLRRGFPRRLAGATPGAGVSPRVSHGIYGQCRTYRFRNNGAFSSA